MLAGIIEADMETLDSKADFWVGLGPRARERFRDGNGLRENAGSPIWFERSSV